jgi:hypothetical protein
MANEFVARKGLISSGSINVSGSVTASFFKGDGSQLTNLPSATVPAGTVSSSTQVASLLPDGTVSSSAQYPGWVTSSAQIDYNSIQNKLSGVVSSSTQVQPLLPAGTVSASSQFTVTSFTNGADNRVLTATSTTAITGESNLTFDGNVFAVNTNHLYVSGGNVGIGTTTPNAKLSVSGSANITGSLDVSGAFTAQTKSFKIDHQELPGKKLVYGVLEGPEHAVYARGKLTDTNIIQLPKEWRWLVDNKSITVQLTPIGKHQQLYVAHIGDDYIVVKNSAMFDNSVTCFYLVHATRKDVEPLQTVV